MMPPPPPPYYYPHISPQYIQYPYTQPFSLYTQNQDWAEQE